MAKHVCAVAETARWPGCGVELGMVGASLPGDLAGWRGTRAGDRKSMCHGGVSAALGAGGDSPLTSTLIFITQLHYGADMKCGAGKRGEINTAPARGAAASPVKSDGFPRPPPPAAAAFSGWWILMEENKRSQKSLSLPSLSPFALCFGSSAGVGWDTARTGARREGWWEGAPLGCSAPTG